MNTTFLNYDSHCKWLNNKVLKGLYPQIMKDARDPRAKKKFVIVDWISNDNGKVGVDLKWFKTLGVPAVQSYKDLPEGDDFSVINTGYDSIVNEEKILHQKGVEIIDEPCPFIRRLRNQFENADDNFQYVLLCEPNHIIIKNFSCIFPHDLILLQRNNYKEKLKEQSNGKPFKLIPYVTFLQQHVTEVLQYMNKAYPDKAHESVDTHCLWVKSKASPIVEINKLDVDIVQQFTSALLITGPATGNKTLASLQETLEDRNIPVVFITTLNEFKSYEAKNPQANVLIVRSPIPNNTEKEVEAYVHAGMVGVFKNRIFNNRYLRGYAIGGFNRIIYAFNWIKYRTGIYSFLLSSQTTETGGSKK